MSATLLTGVTLAYLWTAWEFYGKGNGWMCLVFVAYAVANVGFIGMATR